MNYLKAKTLAFMLLAVLCIPAHATLVYNVSSTSKLNCGGGPHGLWTNTDFGSPSCDDNYFDISGTFTVDKTSADSSAWFGSLVATATNPDSVEASIFLTFTGYSDDHTLFSIKNGGGGVPSTWEFFDSVAGVISFDSPSAYGQTLFNIDAMVGNHAFQIGYGANDKTGAFGGSAWIQSQDMNSHHWDLNLDFHSVPEPTSLVIMGLGLLGFGFSRKKFT